MDKKLTEIMDHVFAQQSTQIVESVKIKLNISKVCDDTF